MEHIVDESYKDAKKNFGPILNFEVYVTLMICMCKAIHYYSLKQLKTFETIVLEHMDLTLLTFCGPHDK